MRFEENCHFGHLLASPCFTTENLPVALSICTCKPRCIRSGFCRGATGCNSRMARWTGSFPMHILRTPHSAHSRTIGLASSTCQHSRTLFQHPSIEYKQQLSIPSVRLRARDAFGNRMPGQCDGSSSACPHLTLAQHDVDPAQREDLVLHLTPAICCMRQHWTPHSSPSPL